MAETEVINLEHLYEASPTPENLDSLEKAKEKLGELLLREEIFWKQQSGVTWLKEGDRNTQDFHAVAQNNRRKLHIYSMTDDIHMSLGLFCPIFRASSVSFYQRLFSSEGCTPSDELLSHIPSLLSHEQNDFLRKVPSEEVHYFLYVRGQRTWTGWIPRSLLHELLGNSQG